jgi:hypothetical protein
MVHRQKLPALATLATVLLLAAAQPSRAASARELAAARESFLALLAEREASGSIGTPIPLAPVGVNEFNRRVTRQGFRPFRTSPRVLGNFPADRAFFRQGYTLELFGQRAARRNGIAGGVFFGPSGTPITPVGPFNIFNYFQIFSY